MRPYQIVLLVLGSVLILALVLGGAVLYVGNQLTDLAANQQDNAPTVSKVEVVTNGHTYTYTPNAANEIWMQGDNGLEELKTYGGVITLTVIDGYEAQINASAGSVSSPYQGCNLGNPMSCEGYYWLKAGKYVFTYEAGNKSAGIMVTLRLE